MNLTSNGVKKFKKNKESLEAKSVIEDVQSNNNQLFSPNYHQFKSKYEEEQEDEIPF